MRQLASCLISPKTKDRQFDNFVVTGGTVSCHMTTYSATSDNKVVKLMTFCFRSWQVVEAFL